MRILQIIPIFFALFLVSACDEPTVLELRQTPPQIVIEALVTDQPDYQYVKITTTTDFYSKGRTPRVTDATVTVTDGQGAVYSFIHNPNDHADSVGYYLPEQPFTGDVGERYSLRVEVDGEVYEATETLLPVTAIDSLSYAINTSEEEDPEEEGKFYEVLLYAKEPRNETNYYLFKYYRNDSLIHRNSTDIYYTDDTLFGEDIDGFPSPVFFGIGDRARLEAYSLSRRGYVFYNDLYTILTTDTGGMFGSIPAPPRSNLSNGALGFFQVSAVVKEEIVIGDGE